MRFLQLILWVFVSLSLYAAENSAGVKHSIGLTGAYSKVWVQDVQASPLIYKGNCPKFGLFYELSWKKNALFLEGDFKIGDLYSNLNRGKFPVAHFGSVNGGIGYKRSFIDLQNKIHLKASAGPYVDNNFFYRRYCFDSYEIFAPKLYFNVTSVNLLFSLSLSMNNHNIQYTAFCPIVSFVISPNEYLAQDLYTELSFLNQTWQFNSVITYRYTFNSHLAISASYKLYYLRCDFHERVKITTDVGSLALIINLYRKNRYVTT